MFRSRECFLTTPVLPRLLSVGVLGQGVAILYRAMLALVVVSLVALVALLFQPPATNSRPVDRTAKRAKAADAGAPKVQSTAKTVAQLQPEATDAEVCADCHPDEVAGFAKTGMGRSLYTPANAKIIEDFSAEKATVTDERSGYVYRAFIDDKGVWYQAETFPGSDYFRQVRVTHVVGSGNHTRSYLGEVSGEVIQLPLTWYVERGIWDLSPGYDSRNLRFTRHVVPKCLFCHNDLTPARPGTESGYARALAEGISCVRCHGDARAHVEARTAGLGPPPGEADDTIINPKRLPEVRQRRICEQCHLQGDARILLEGESWDRYDVSKPLEKYMSIYATKADTEKFEIASHGHRLQLSKCAQGDKPLTCTTCHNPHAPESDLSKRDGCLTCHGGDDCGSKHGAKPDADCASCHMHRGGTSDIPHVTFTDHFIRLELKAPLFDEPYDPTELVDIFAKTRTGEADPKAKLRHALAVQEIATDGRVVNAADFAIKGIELLGALVDEFADDVRLWKGLGDLQKRTENAEASLAAFEKAAELTPDDPLVLFDLAMGYDAVKEHNRIEKPLRRAVELRPDFGLAWTNLATSLQVMKRHYEAELAYAKADQLEPYNATLAYNRARNTMSRGFMEEAENQYRSALERDPTDLMAMLNYGVYAFDLNSMKLVIELMSRAVTINDRYAPAYWLRGRAYRSSAKLDLAAEDFETLTKLEPKRISAYIELAENYAQMGNPSLARDALVRGQMSAGDDPRFDQAIQRLGFDPDWERLGREMARRIRKGDYRGLKSR